MATLGEALEKLVSTDEVTPTDVALKMLDPKDAVMHTEIRNVGVMNALHIMHKHRERQNRTLTSEFWKDLYDDNVLHMVSYKRQRSKELVKMFASIMALFGVPGDKNKDSLFGSKK